MNALWHRLINLIPEGALARNLLATVVLVIGVFLLRRALLRFVRTGRLGGSEVMLRGAVKVRWVALGILIMGLIVVWASELRAFALSLVAIAVALVLATKEIILCLSGALVRASARSFEIGDRIEVDQVRGDVIDHGALTTTILEIGPSHQRTGRVIVIPNGVFVTQKVANETFTGPYVLHTVTVPLRMEDDWRQAQARLLELAGEVCAPYLVEARRELDATAREHGLPLFSVAPRVMLRVPEPGQIQLLLRVPTPARERDTVEQQILTRFLEAAGAEPGPGG